MAKTRASENKVSARSSIMVVLPWVLVVLLTALLIASFYENRLAILQGELENLEEETLDIRAELAKADEESLLLEEIESPEPEETEANLILPANNTTEATTIIIEQVAVDTPAKPDPVGALELPGVEVEDARELATTAVAQFEVLAPTLEEPVPEAKVTDEAIVYPEAKTQGRVLVSELNKSRLMIDLGKKDEIEIGARFTVWSNGRYVGEAQVTEVFAQMSACKVVTAAKRGIRVGDTVREVNREISFDNIQLD